MGNSGGQSSDEHYDRRLSVKVREATDSVIGPSSRVIHVGSSNSKSRNIHSRMVEARGDQGDSSKNSSPLLKAFYKRKEKWQITSHNRPFRSQSAPGGSHIQDGNSSSDFQKSHRDSVGLLSRYRGRVFPCPNSLGISQIPGLPTTREDICVPISSVRPLTSSLGFFESNKANKETSPYSNDIYFQLLGRLHHLFKFSGETEGSHRKCVGSPPKFRVQNKLGEIESGPVTGDRVPRSVLEPTDTRTFSPSGEDHSHQRPVPGDSEERKIVKKRTGEFDRHDELCLELHSTGKTSSSSHSYVAKSPHSSMLQRCPSASGREIQGTDLLLEKSRIYEPSSSDAVSQTVPRSNDGCVTRWMVRNSTSEESVRSLANERKTLLHELEGVESSTISSDRVQTCSKGEVSSGSIGQYDGSSLSKESGISETCSPSCSDNRNINFLQKLGNQSSPSTSKRCSERPGGSRLSSSSHSHRVVIGQEDFHLVEQAGSTVPSGPICDKGEYSTSSVRVPMSGSSSSGVQCIQLGLEQVDVHIPYASDEYSGGRCQSSSGLPGKRGSDSPSLAIERLVPSPPSQVQGSPSSSSTGSHIVPEDFEGFDDSQGRTLLESSRLDSLISSLVEKGANESSIKVIKHAHKPSTMKQYEGTWKKFMEFLSMEDIQHDKVDVYVVMNFLAYQHVVKGLKFRTITTYKSALAQPLFEQFNLRLDNASLDFFMKGVFNLDPPKPAPMAEWSLDSLLSFLVSEHFEPLHSMSLSVVSRKFLCLLLLATGRRIDEIGNLAQRYDFAVGGKSVTVHYVPDYKPKHFNKDFQPDLPSFEGLDSDQCEDLQLCPIRAFRIYLGKIQSNPRGSISRPLWTHSSKNLTNMFISTVVQAKHFAGDLSVNPVGPHQMRKFAASYSAKMVLSSVEGERKVMERMGCKTMSVLKRHYINNIPYIRFKAVFPAGTFIPDVHFST